MAAFDYVNAHAVAERLITKFGQPANVIKKGNAGGYDTSGNVIAAQPDVTISGKVSPKVDFKLSETDGENVIMGDAYCYFDSVTPPEIGMMITLNSEEFRIINLKILDSVDNINVYRRMQLRR